MKKLVGLILCLIWLAACSENVENEPEKETPVEKVTETPAVESETEQEVEQVETPIEEDEAIAISKQLTAEFNQLMRELGEKNGWDFEHPADYETAKSELLKVATEEFSDRELKDYVESYYCNCDSGWFPELNDRTVRLTTERDVDEFTIKGLVLPNHVSGGYELTMHFARDVDNSWKIDGWDSRSFIGENMNFTMEEVQQAHPDYTVTEEMVLEEYNVTVYKGESDFEVVGFSKKDGMIYLIE